MTVPKGSAPIILDAMNTLSSLAVVGAVVQAMKFLLRPRGDAGQVAKAIKADPSFSKSIKLLKDDFPSLSLALGLGSFAETLGDEDGRIQLSITAPSNASNRKSIEGKT